MSNHRVVRLYQRLSAYPLGRWLFARGICLKAPYFHSIRPQVRALAPGCVQVAVRKRRRVTNHIGTVHAIAMANACELAAGLVTEITIPVSMRWIPRGMTIRYQRKAATDIVAEALLELQAPLESAADIVVPVVVTDTHGDVVVTAEITMYVSSRTA